MVPRPPGNTDKLLIRAACEFLPETGLDQMNLREIAAKAGVSLGMFHHLFGTKERFVEAVLRETYEDFFRDFSLGIEEIADPLLKLRKGLFSLGQFTHKHRKMFVSMLQDMAGGNVTVRNFVSENFGRHGAVFHELIRRCQKTGQLRKIPLFEAMLFIMPGVNAAGIVVGLLERFEGPLDEGGSFDGVLSVLSDKAIQRRVDMALIGLGARQEDLK
jgi:AcrR family transcriptional regulator